MNGLKEEPGWAPCLCYVVEFLLREIETADQRFDGAVVWIHGNECRFKLWHLGNAPVIVAVLYDPDNGAALDLFTGRSIGTQTRSGEVKSIAGDRDLFTGRDDSLDLFWRGFEYDSGKQVVIVR